MTVFMVQTKNSVIHIFILSYVDEYFSIIIECIRSHIRTPKYDIFSIDEKYLSMKIRLLARESRESELLNICTSRS